MAILCLSLTPPPDDVRLPGAVTLTLRLRVPPKIAQFEVRFVLATATDHVRFRDDTGSMSVTVQRSSAEMDVTQNLDLVCIKPGAAVVDVEARVYVGGVLQCWPARACAVGIADSTCKPADGWNA